MEDLLFTLLDTMQLLSLFEKVVRKRLMVRWPPSPDEEAEKAHLKQLHARLLSLGFDRGLASELSARDVAVRAHLAQLRQQTGGILTLDDPSSPQEKGSHL